MGLIKEFKEFALKGNVLDLAVAVIIGAEFGKIVNSLVKDVVMPPVGYIAGGMDFSEIKIPIAGSEKAAINIGLFINACISFAIIAFAVFMIVKVANAAKKRFMAEEAPVTPPTAEDILLLREIRDSLASRR
jgi:large conductance mechanosensitive channel